MTKKGLRPVTLAIDSAGSACSAVVAAGDTILSAERVEGSHGQAEALMPMVDYTMRKAGLPPAALDLVVTTVGPGSFTGIRVGLATARGIALATGARLIGVTSFSAAAASAAHSNCSNPRLLLVSVESRREDLYIQFFDPAGDPLGRPAVVMPFALGDATSAAIGTRPLLIAGDAAHRAAAALRQHRQVSLLEDPAPGAVGTLQAGLRLLRLGKADDAPRPLYLRPPDVTLPGRLGKPSRTPK